MLLTCIALAAFMFRQCPDHTEDSYSPVNQLFLPPRRSYVPRALLLCVQHFTPIGSSQIITVPRQPIQLSISVSRPVLTHATHAIDKLCCCRIYACTIPQSKSSS